MGSPHGAMRFSAIVVFSDHTRLLFKGLCSRGVGQILTPLLISKEVIQAYKRKRSASGPCSASIGACTKPSRHASDYATGYLPWYTLPCRIINTVFWASCPPNLDTAIAYILHCFTVAG